MPLSFSRTDYFVGTGPYHSATGDFDGDGILDLACANPPSNSVSIVLGEGDGTLQSQQLPIAESGPLSIVVGDLNADGKLDLVVTNNTVGTLSVFLGNGDGSFQSRVNYGVGNEPHYVVIADLNGDNKPDVTVADWIDGTVSILRQLRGLFRRMAAGEPRTGPTGRDSALSFVMASDGRGGTPITDPSLTSAQSAY